MNIQEVFNRIVVETGQFNFDPKEIEIDLAKFSILVDSVLGTFNRYRPYRRQFNITTNSRVYTFTENPVIDPVRIDSGIQDPSLTAPHGIPEWLSDCIPVRISGVPTWYFHDRDPYRYDMVKESFPWVYRKPNLYVNITGTFDIKSVHYHHQIKTVNPDGTKNYELPTLDQSEDAFFDLIRARFLKALGRSRRAFTLNDMPISNDASDLTGEGNEIEEKTLEDLRENQNRFYLAYG